MGWAVLLLTSLKPSVSVKQAKGLLADATVLSANKDRSFAF